MNRHGGDELTLKVAFNDRYSEKGHSSGLGTTRGRGTGRKIFNKAIVECWGCHQLGRFQYECPM